jgi:hypothetical protein
VLFLSLAVLFLTPATHDIQLALIFKPTLQTLKTLSGMGKSRLFYIIMSALVVCVSAFGGAFWG